MVQVFLKRFLRCRYMATGLPALPSAVLVHRTSSTAHSVPRLRLKLFQKSSAPLNLNYVI